MSICQDYDKARDLIKKFCLLLNNCSEYADLYNQVSAIVNINNYKVFYGQFLNGDLDELIEFRMGCSEDTMEFSVIRVQNIMCFKQIRFDINHICIVRGLN
ncbi:hypothetical protein HC766_01780 [Candidatus Gracilibacteria bacterium]|nr:hypothetical protein [Candidatus Gracilibacteria bacterium]